MKEKAKAAISLLAGTKIGKVASAAGKKLATSPQQLMNKTVNDALSAKGAGAVAKRAKEITRLNKLYGQKIKLDKTGKKVLKYPEFSKIKNDSVSSGLGSEARQSQSHGADMLRQYFNPGTENPALRGLGEGLETIAPESLAATKYRRWGTAGAAAWIGSNFLRRGDQIGPF